MGTVVAIKKEPKEKYAEAGGVKRPFRLWNAKEKAFERYRYYESMVNAHNAALIETSWKDVGVSIEVVDIRGYHLLGVYTRKLNTVQIQRFKS